MSGSHFSVKINQQTPVEVNTAIPTAKKPKFTQDSINSQNNKVHRVRSGKFGAQSAFDRHKHLVNNYLLYYGKDKRNTFKRDKTKFKRDIDIVKENHRFLWEDDEGIKGLILMSKTNNITEITCTAAIIHITAVTTV